MINIVLVSSLIFVWSMPRINSHKKIFLGLMFFWDDKHKNRYFSEKEKKMQNVLKRKICPKYFVTFLEGYPLKTFFLLFTIFFPLEPKFVSFIKTYLLDHSASFDMHIEKL